MKNVSAILKPALMMGLVISSIATAAPTHMIEVIELQKGKTLKDVTLYLEKVTPIIARYGAQNEQVYMVTKMGDQSRTPKVTLVWEIEDMSQLPKVFEDKAYLAQVPLRDSVLKVNERVQFLGQRVQ